MDKIKERIKEFFRDHIIIICISFVLLLILLAAGILESYYARKDVFKATVVEIDNKTIRVEYGTDHGDPVKVEMKKPLLQKIQKYDYVCVYEENGELKLALFGDKLGDICGLILLILLFILIPYIMLYKKLKNKKDVYLVLFGVSLFFGLVIYFIFKNMGASTSSGDTKYMILLILPALFGILFAIESWKNRGR